MRKLTKLLKWKGSVLFLLIVVNYFEIPRYDRSSGRYIIASGGGVGGRASEGVNKKRERERRITRRVLWVTF